MREAKVKYIYDDYSTEEKIEVDAVLLMEENFGITVVDPSVPEDHPDRYLMCQRGPDDPKFQVYTGADEEWQIAWDMALKAEESGVYYEEEHDELLDEAGLGDMIYGPARAGTCSFGG